MEATLAIVTLISLALAVTMTVVAFRLLREERRRSDARVAALAFEASGAEEAPVARLAAIGPADRLRQGYGGPPELHAKAEAGPYILHEDAIQDHAVREDEHGVSGAPPLFATAEPPEGGLIGRLVAVVALGALVVGVTGFLFAKVGSSTSAEPTIASSAPLELLALRHERQGDRLTIAGTVRNPAGAAPARAVTAVAFLFDRDGSFLTSSRAALDFTALGPGEESPFVVSVTAPEASSRYRVSFRNADGGVLTHVDRRDSGRDSGRD